MKAWRLLILVVAAILAGCSKYESIDRPYTATSALDSLAISRRLSVKKFLANGSTILIIPRPLDTAVYAFGGQGVSEARLGDLLASDVRGTSLDGEVKVAKEDGISMALVLARTSTLSGGALVNRPDIENALPHLRAGFGDRIYFSNSFLPYPHEGGDYAVLGGAAPNSAIRMPLSADTWKGAAAYLFFAPLCALGLIFFGWCMSRPFRSVEARRLAYAWTVYPISLVSMFFILSQATSHWSNDVEFLARYFAPNYRVVNAYLELAPFGLPLIAVLGELLLFPARPGGSSFAVYMRSAHRLRYAWSGMALGILLAVPLKSSGPPFIVFALGPAMMGLVSIGRKNEKTTPMPDWQPEVDAMAARFQVGAPKLELELNHDMIHHKNWPEFSVIAVGKKLLDRSSEAEVEFLLASQVALAKTAVIPSSPAPVAFIYWLLAGSIFVCATSLRTALCFGFLGAGFAAIIVWVIIMERRARPQSIARDFAMDTQALTYTRDLPAAMSALEKTLPAKSDKDMAKLRDRIANLQMYADEMGLLEPA